VEPIDRSEHRVQSVGVLEEPVSQSGQPCWLSRVARNSSNALLSADSNLIYQGSLATPLSFGFKLQPRWSNDFNTARSQRVAMPLLSA
jgi:hypothetical protein